MYKVLNKETKEKIEVEKIDTSKHLHLSGREFNKETDKLTYVETKKKKTTPKVEAKTETKEVKEVTTK